MIDLLTSRDLTLIDTLTPVYTSNGHALSTILISQKMALATKKKKGWTLFDLDFKLEEH